MQWPSAVGSMFELCKKTTDEAKVHLDNEVQKLPLDIVSIDGIHKVAELFFWHNGKKTLDTVMTGVNAWDQTRINNLCVREGHEQSKPSLDAAKGTMKKHGMGDGPGSVFPDDPTRDD